MKFKIVGDSCTDLTIEDLKKDYFSSVPLTIDVDGYEIVDDHTFNQSDFLRRVAAFEGCPKSACPSPDAYMKSYEGAEDVYVITLSSHLSGSYNSAVLAKELYREEHPEAKVHVFDSMSAASGQRLIALLIEKYALEGLDYGDIVEKVTKYIEEMKTVFVLESLDALRKNGRLSSVKALVANALNIKPFMTAEKGVILQAGQARGINKALNKMVDYIGEIGSNFDKKTVMISQCNCLDRAKNFEKVLKEKYHFKETIIIETRGISSLYASDGGIIVCF